HCEQAALAEGIIPHHPLANELPKAISDLVQRFLTLSNIFSMNAQLAAPVPQSEPVPTPFLEISTLTPQAADSKTPRPHGKIARLPKLLRDQLNSMLDDGLPYLRLSDSHFCSPILSNRSLPSRHFSLFLAISRSQILRSKQCT